MPQGKGTYGSQVGRPSKKRTSYVNDNKWYDTVSQASSRYHELSEGQGGEESESDRVPRPPNPGYLWEKESASLNKSMSIARMINEENRAFAERRRRNRDEEREAIRIISAPPEQ